MHANLKAFLDMLAWSEGTDHPRQKTNDRGYDVIVGGSLMDGYSDHPRRVVDLPALKIKSTAAGRYQILARYWDAYRKQLCLVGGFTPANQDAIAVQLIRECRAYVDIEVGNVAAAIRKCASRWASLPGAGYGQREHSMSELIARYEKAGGFVA